MNRIRRAGCSKWALVALTAATLALAGCGRKGGLDLPPQAAVQPVPDNTAPVPGTVFDPNFGVDAPPAATAGRKRGFILDPLLGN